MDTKKVWFITGASKGLGLTLVKKLLAEGYQVAATSRTTNVFATEITDHATHFLPLETDLTSDASIANAIKQTIARFGRIDVVVNNAGYGIGGAIEELSEAEMMQSFEVNVFAALRVIRHAMPHLRAQRSGHIINISSIAGYAGTNGWGMYAATKFAITGMTEVLAEDVKELGIHATVVAPGGFRTNFLNPDSIVYAAHKIIDYQSIRAVEARFAEYNGKQIGDPQKAAEAMIQLVHNPNPPVRLFLGSDAYKRALDKIDAVKAELVVNESVTLSTDY